MCPQPTMERIVEEYGTPMLRLSCMYLTDRMLAEDAVQDAFVKIYKSWPGFENQAAEKSWIMRVTGNVCKDCLRSAWQRRVSLVEHYPDVAVEEDAHSEEGRLYQEILRLPLRYRQVIVLYYDQQLKIREIAHVLGVPSSTVSMQLYRARKILRKKLGDISPDER